MIEAGLSVIVVCLPTLQSLMRREWAKNFGRKTHHALTSLWLFSRRTTSRSSTNVQRTTSEAELTPKPNNAASYGVQTWAMTAVRSQSKTEDGRIVVRKELDREYEMV